MKKVKAYSFLFKQDGKKTICTGVNHKGTAVGGEVVCSENDEFILAVGMMISMCRALGLSPMWLAEQIAKVMKSHHPSNAGISAMAAEITAKPGEVYIPDARNGKYMKVVCRTEGGLLGVLESEAKVKPGVPDDYVWWYESCGGMIGKEFVDSLPVWAGPHCGETGEGEAKVKPEKRKRKVLREGMTKISYGVCGDKTPYKDCDGKPLVVGDLVTLDRYRDGKKNALPGLYYVVKTEADGPFVMSIAGACCATTGKVKGFRVKKAKSWKEVEVGEYHCFIECRLEDAE